MISHKLMIKTHIKTKLKYLCYTRSEGKEYDNYKGSGVYWKKHLKKHGTDITTEIIFESEDFDVFKTEAIKKSIQLDIVNSVEWANLKIEEGDGGDTVSNKKWITNGIKDIYLNNDKLLPEGWKYGRSFCVFNDPINQSTFSLICDSKIRGKSIKEAWDNGKMDKRDNSKCGTKGDLNPAKRQDIRLKISKGNSKKVKVKNKFFNSIKEATIYFKVCYNTIHKWVDNERCDNS